MLADSTLKSTDIFNSSMTVEMSLCYTLLQYYCVKSLQQLKISLVAMCSHNLKTYTLFYCQVCGVVRKQLDKLKDIVHSVSKRLYWSWCPTFCFFITMPDLVRPIPIAHKIFNHSISNNPIQSSLFPRIDLVSTKQHSTLLMTSSSSCISLGGSARRQRNSTTMKFQFSSTAMISAYLEK